MGDQQVGARRSLKEVIQRGHSKAGIGEYEVPEPDDVEDEPTPPGLEWLNDRDEHGLLTWVNDPAKVAAFEKYRAETPARPLTPGEQAQEDALNHLAALREKLDQLRRAELQSYADSLSAAITTRLDQLNLNVPIHVTVALAPNDAHLRYGTTALPGDSYTRIDDAIASAIAETPSPAMLPGTPLERAERLGYEVS